MLPNKIIFTFQEVEQMIIDERKACAKIAEKIAWDAFKKREKTGLPSIAYLSLDGQASAALEINKLILERNTSSADSTANQN